MVFITPFGLARQIRNLAKATPVFFEIFQDPGETLELLLIVTMAKYRMQ